MEDKNKQTMSEAQKEEQSEEYRLGELEDMMYDCNIGEYESEE